MAAVELTPPGRLMLRDFRPSTDPKERSNTTVKLVQWNIERGYKLPGIIEELRQVDADVISLQEVDVGCERSGGLDTGLAIAEALQMNYVFLSEFEELASSVRSPETQGGGVHGNAILTRFDIRDPQVVPHRTHPVDWNNPSHPLARKEPRRGERAILRATVETPQGPLVVYCAHLEVFCGLLARVAQLADIFRDARSMADAGFPHQAILGDMNTMAHGIARLSPHYCCDFMRWRSLGLDEAAVWDRYVLPVQDPRYADASSSGSSADAATISSSAARRDCSSNESSDIRQAVQEVEEEAQQAMSSFAQEPPAADAEPGAAAAPARQATSEPQVAASRAAARIAPAVPDSGQQAAGDVAPEQAAAAPEHASSSAATAAGAAPINAQLLRWGLSAEVAQDACNPGFSDPFNSRTTTTLDNPKYRWLGMSLMRGKLDWCLLRRLHVAGTAVGNMDFSLSDHRWLAVNVSLH